MQRSRRYLSYKLSYSQFCLKFRCHGNKGRSEVNLNDPVELAVPENHTLGRSSLFIKLMSYTPLRYVRNVAREE